MSIKVYHYPQCGTCRKALKWFKDHKIEVETQHIVDDPPTKEQLRDWIRQSELGIRKFFNTSGQVYKQLNLKEKLPNMSEEEMIELLAANGKLIKRPIVVQGQDITVGFNEEQFQVVWGRS